MSERYRRAKEIFLAVCDLELAEQVQRLDRECGDDAELRAEVESLLAHHGEPPTATVAPSLPASGETGGRPRRVGPYRVVHELGRGGMGVVYLGVRDDDQFKQHVAIKVLKRGMDTDEILRRFELERQLLAALNHPGIARLYDGGRTEEGLPFFAMEYVEGLAIHDYCDTHRLRIGERLEVFRAVCAAVHYAHQNLVVHRDLKPSNIVVNREGVPKLLDFGIAKVINPGMSQFAGDPTAPGIRLMTPEYASPEQVRGDPISTASDVYSLGVLLYELVTGHRPYRLASRLDEEIRRVICEVDPERPSTAVSKIEEIEADAEHPATHTTTITPEFVSKSREGRPDRLRRRLAGDIDDIVLMAMRKEPQRRYRSAEQFSEDLRRHLDGLPVIATRDTAVYRMSKFVRRHRVGVGAAAAVVLAVTLGIVGTTMGYVAQRSQRIRTELMFGQVLSLAHTFIFDFHDKIAPLDGSLPARELLVTTALDCLDGLTEHVGDDADLQRELASSYDKIGGIQGGIRNPAHGDTANALESYLAGLRMRESLAAEFPQDLELRKQLVLSHMHVGDVYGRTGRIEMATEQHAKAVEIAETLADADPDYRRTLGIQLIGVGRSQYRFGLRAEARRTYDRALRLRRQLIGEEAQSPLLRRDLSVALIRVAAMQAESGEDDAALEGFAEAVELREQLAADDPDTGRARRDLGVALYYTAEFLLSRDQVEQAAEPVARFLAISRQRVLDNPTDARSRLDLAAALEFAGIVKLSSNDAEGALRDFGEFAGIMVDLTEADPAQTQYQRRLADSQRRLADVRNAQGDVFGTAIGYQRAIEILTALTEADAEDTLLQLKRAELLQSFGEVLLDAQGLDEAQERLDEAAEIYRALLERQPDHADVRRGLVKTLRSVALAMEARGYTESAVTYAQQALAELAKLSNVASTDALRAAIEADLRRYKQ